MRSLWRSAWLLGLLAPSGGVAVASPLDDPHVGGIAFGGPTDGDLTAVFWNPAALGLLEGTQAMIAASGQLTTTRVRRASIDPATGRPGGGRAFPSVNGRGDLNPLSWPPGPGGFAAVGSAIGNRFTLALAAYTPYAQRLSYGATDGEEPARYHLVEADLRNVALVPALAIRVGNEVRIGAAPGFLFSTGRLVFDEDTALYGGSGMNGLGADCGGSPCGAENPAAAARYEVASGLGPFDSALAFTLAGGLYYRSGRLAAGLAFSSHPLGGDVGGVEVDARRSRVQAPPRAGAAAPCPADRPQGCAYGQMTYDLPDTWTMGVTWQATPELAVTGIIRYLTFSRHEQIAIRMVGPAPAGLRTAGLAERVVLHRGFTDTFEARLRATRTFGTRVRAAAMLRAQSAAVPADRLNPGAIDGTTIEPALAAEVHLGWLRLSAGYAFAFAPTRSTGDSVFDPAAATACADAGGDLAQEPCQSRLRGSARPSAAGEYSFVRHAFSMTATVRF